MRRQSYGSVIICALLLSVPAQSDSRELPETYQLRYWEGLVQYFETDTYFVSVTISDGFETPDHTVSIVGKSQDFQTSVPLGLQSGHYPVIEDITKVSLCDQDLIVVDFRWPLNGEILVSAYERLFVTVSHGALVASLNDSMSAKINGLFPAENMKLFYNVTCEERLTFVPKPHEAFVGGGIILTDRPGH